MLRIAFMICMTASLATANVLVCSNAEQTFSFEHRTSNGGQALDETTVSYEGQGAFSSNPTSGLAVNIRIEQVGEFLDDQPIEGTSGTVKTYAAKASGSFQLAAEKGEKPQFVDVPETWVICKDYRYPFCQKCP